MFAFCGGCGKHKGGHEMVTEGRFMFAFCTESWVCSHLHTFSRQSFNPRALQGGAMCTLWRLGSCGGEKCQASKGRSLGSSTTLPARWMGSLSIEIQAWPANCGSFTIGGWRDSGALWRSGPQASYPGLVPSSISLSPL
jgi:hypothetical protein